jgi:hypothetical protein
MGEIIQKLSAYSPKIGELEGKSNAMKKCGEIRNICQNLYRWSFLGDTNKCPKA